MQPGDVVGPAGSAPKKDEPVEQVTDAQSVQVSELAANSGVEQNTPDNQQPESNWQFSADENQSANSDQTTHDAVTWTASEYIAHEKGGSWYILLAVAVVIGSAFVYLITREVVSTVVIAVMGIAFGAFAARKPQELEYILDESGLKVGSKLYMYSQFKSFTVVEEGAIDSIMLMPLQRFMPPLSVYFDPADEEKIINALSAYLPYEDRKQDPVDRLMRKVRF